MLSDYTDVFPAELPKVLPNQTNVTAQHHLNLFDHAKVPARRLYKVSL